MKETGYKASREGGDELSLIVYDLFGEKRDKVQHAIDLVRSFEPPDKYYLAYSGGKDSIVVEAILRMAGVGYEIHYNMTTVDPPELVRFIKTQYPDVALDYPRDADGNVITMWNLIPQQTIPPTRKARYCCDKLKESGGEGRLTVTGVRWAESPARKQNQGEVVIMKTGRVKGVKESPDFTPTMRGGGGFS